jgi:Coenzyme PQQ synthesis protein D (PqqD)
MSDIPSPESVAPDSLAGLTVTVPDHVVFRVFAAETVVLNIDTGQYHGLNPVAGRMLETLQRTSDLETAARDLAGEFEQPVERIERDLRAFCDDLAGRGLLEIHGAETL